MSYQQCRYKNQIEKIPIRTIDGQSYVFLDDIHDRFRGVQYFTCFDKPIPFEYDKDHIRLKPWRIQAFPGNFIDCYMPMENDKVISITDNDFKQEILQIRADVKKTLENTEILKTKADAILRQTFELEEFAIPRLFFVFPESNTTRFNPNDWFHLNYRLYFLCECEDGDGPHFAFHEGYKIKQPREFLRKYSSYLRTMLPVVNYAIPASSSFVKPLLNNTGGISDSFIHQSQMAPDNLDSRYEQTLEILNRVEPSKDNSKQRTVQYVQGPELREIEQFLKIVDSNNTFGNLYRSVTKDGHVRWMCIHHHEQCYSDRKIMNLHEEFQNLGGEIRQDTAIIDEQIGNNVSPILNILRRGLRVCSIILKNLNIEEKEFNELLSYFSQHSSIHYVEIDNITVVSLPFNTKKRFIIPKLDETVRANDKLTIQYNFTKPLSTFDSKVVDTITKTDPRLIFQLRSREDTSLVELTGNSKVGFTLSISNSEEKNDTIYKTAVNNIFYTVPNIIKVFLYEGAISKNTWSSFYQFLTSTQSLQELTIDCSLTVVQITELLLSLSHNETLKMLSIFNVQKIDNELKPNTNLFQMLTTYNIANKSISTGYTNQIEFDFVARYLLENKSLRVLKLSNCTVDQNTDIELIENFLKTTSVHILTLGLMSTDNQEFLKRFAHAVNENETLNTVELKGLNSSAVFHRVVSTQIDHKKNVPIEPFYPLCNYPLLYKQIQDISQNLKLEELLITVEDNISMKNISLGIKSNSTVTQLTFDRRILTKDDILLLGEALRSNSTITHLILKEIKLSITDIHHFFQFLHDDRILRILEITDCVSDSYHNLFIEEIKSLEIKNPFLKIIYENS